MFLSKQALYPPADTKGGVAGAAGLVWCLPSQVATSWLPSVGEGAGRLATFNPLKSLWLKRFYHSNGKLRRFLPEKTVVKVTSEITGVF